MINLQKNKILKILSKICKIFLCFILLIIIIILCLWFRDYQSFLDRALPLYSTEDGVYLEYNATKYYVHYELPENWNLYYSSKASTDFFGKKVNKIDPFYFWRILVIDANDPNEYFFFEYFASGIYFPYYISENIVYPDPKNDPPTEIEICPSAIVSTHITIADPQEIETVMNELKSNGDISVIFEQYNLTDYIEKNEAEIKYYWDTFPLYYSWNYN